MRAIEASREHSSRFGPFSVNEGIGPAAPFLWEPGGRLSGVSETPAPAVDADAVNTLYYVEYIHSFVPIWNGKRFVPYEIQKENTASSGIRQIQIPAAGLGAGNQYDVFCRVNRNAPELVFGPVWASDTARASAGALLRLNGRLVLQADTKQTYLGTIRSLTANKVMDTEKRRFVFNMYNRVPRKLKVTEATDSWTYSTNTWRSWNNTTVNRVEVLCGQADVHVRLVFNARGFNNTAATNQGAIGIDLDGTIAGSDADVFAAMGSGVEAIPGIAIYDGYPGLGYHFLQLMEIGGGGGTSTWVGDGGVPTWIQSGAVGAVLG